MESLLKCDLNDDASLEGYTIQPALKPVRSNLAKLQ